MKIGIMTHPLGVNYGGILQNYALQKILIDLGHDVYTIGSRESFLIYNYLTGKDYVWWRIKQNINKYLGKRYFASKKEFCIMRKHCYNFIENNIVRTETCRNQDQLIGIVHKYNFDALIVGSDQIWRPSMVSNIYNSFLDFCQDDKHIKRIAYAASFGVDNWEFSKEQELECSRLAKLFDAISVREDSGIELCHKYLDVKASLVLDPTLLLKKEDYIQLVKCTAASEEEKEIEGNLFCYIFEDKKEIQFAIKKIEEEYGLKGFHCKVKKDLAAMKYGDNIDDYIIPSPTKWLHAFMGAKMILTDSFHGCVFSIIFNKPFWAIGNEWRGNARFDSLLRLFNLEHRSINLEELNKIDMSKPIEWDGVNAILLDWRKRSMDFLKNNL